MAAKSVNQGLNSFDQTLAAEERRAPANGTQVRALIRQMALANSPGTRSLHSLNAA